MIRSPCPIFPAMNRSRVRMIGATAGLVATAAFAQSVKYTSVEAVAGKALQLTYHASVHKDCRPGRIPTVRVIEPPTSGTLTVRAAQLTTPRVPGCPPVKAPAQVIFYEFRVGYAGPDHVKYEVTSENGAVATYDTTIAVKAGPAPSPPSNTRDL